MHLSRRHFGLTFAAPFATPLLGAPARKKTVAAIVTVYHHLSHADVLLGRLLAGNSVNNQWRPARTHVVSLYTDQVPGNMRDQSRDLASRFGYKIFPTIRETLTLGGDKLAVDAVCFIGEQGDYPYNDVGQQLYPRYEMLNQILDVYEASGRSVPTFSDKHLSYDWNKAKQIWERARKLKTPLMAGSSIPLSVRTPLLELPLETPLTHAISAGHGQPDAYGFHTLEALQCMVERRKGGETGVAWVEYLEGDAVKKWLAGDGAWSRPLLEDAVRRNPNRKPISLDEEFNKPVVFLIGYRDGLKAASFIVTPAGSAWTFACRRANSSNIESCYYGLGSPGRLRPHFDGLAHCVEELFITGKPTHPLERTVLTTGVLAMLFESKRYGKRIETPDLNITYRAPERAFFQTS